MNEAERVENAAIVRREFLRLLRHREGLIEVLRLYRICPGDVVVRLRSLRIQGDRALVRRERTGGVALSLVRRREGELCRVRVGGESRCSRQRIDGGCDLAILQVECAERQMGRYGLRLARHRLFRAGESLRQAARGAIESGEVKLDAAKTR